MRLCIRPGLAAGALVGAGSLALPAFAGSMDGALVESAEHQPATAVISKSTVAYETPALSLVRDDGKRVSLAREMYDGRPVPLNFIFTTCSSLWPLAREPFAHIERTLGPESKAVHPTSISLNP